MASQPLSHEGTRRGRGETPQARRRTRVLPAEGQCSATYLILDLERVKLSCESIHGKQVDWTGHNEGRGRGEGGKRKHEEHKALQKSTETTKGEVSGLKEIQKHKSMRMGHNGARKRGARGEGEQRGRAHTSRPTRRRRHRHRRRTVAALSSSAANRRMTSLQTCFQAMNGRARRDGKGCSRTTRKLTN